MQDYSKRIFIAIWVSALLIATFGVSVEQVYCYCTGKTRMAWMVEDMGCQRTASATTVKTQSCCAKKKTAHAKCHKENKQGCTKRTTYVFQLKTEYEVAQPEFKKLDVPVFELPAAVLPAFLFALPRIEKEVYAANDLPPPLSGRAICVRHGIFRC